MENKVDKKPTAAATTKTSQPHAQKTFEMLNVEMEPRLLAHLQLAFKPVNQTERGKWTGKGGGKGKEENYKLRSAAEKWQLQKIQCRRQNLADNASAAPTDGTVSSLSLPVSLSQLVAAIVPLA